MYITNPYIIRGKTITEDFENLNFYFKLLKDNVAKFHPSNILELKDKLDTLETLNNDIDILKQIIENRHKEPQC